MLGSSAYFVHGGLGVTWPHVTGNVSQTWSGAFRGSTETPLGFGQLGFGHRARNAKHGRWMEVGLEADALTPQIAVYVRASFGVF